MHDSFVSRQLEKYRMLFCGFGFDSELGSIAKFLMAKDIQRGQMKMFFNDISSLILLHASGSKMAISRISVNSKRRRGISLLKIQRIYSKE